MQEQAEIITTIVSDHYTLFLLKNKEVNIQASVTISTRDEYQK